VSAPDRLGGTVLEAFGQHTVRSDMVGDLTAGRAPASSGLVRLVCSALVLRGTRAWWLRSRQSAAPAARRLDRELEGAVA
jgi:hypothetical protein